MNSIIRFRGTVQYLEEDKTAERSRRLREMLPQRPQELLPVLHVELHGNSGRLKARW